MVKTSQENKRPGSPLGSGEGGWGPSAGRCEAGTVAPPPTHCTRGACGEGKVLPTDRKTGLPQPAPSAWDKGHTSPSLPQQRPTCHPAALNQLGQAPSPGVNQLRPAPDGRAKRGSETLLSCADGETEG